MYGLRLMNNNYTAAGDGRDLVINYDAGFRGGKLFQDKLPQHLPKPWVNPRSSGKSRVSTEPHEQTLHLTRSTVFSVNEKKERLQASSKLHFPMVSTTSLDQSVGSVVGASPGLLRSASSPGGLGVSSGFRPRWDTPAVSLDCQLAVGEDPQKEQPFGQLPQLETSMSGTWVPADPLLSWPAPRFLDPRHGFGRMESGCPWLN